MFSIAEYIKILTELKFRRRKREKRSSRKKLFSLYFKKSMHNLSHPFKKKISQTRLTNYCQDKNAKKSQAWGAIGG